MMRSYPNYVPDRLVEPVSKRDHTQGPLDAPMTLVEYGDYQCPYCRDADPVVKALLQEFGESMVYAFRNMPLYTIHDLAMPAAQAAESAALQDAFWPMHDVLFANQPNFALEDLVGYARALGLDWKAFVAGMEDPRVLHRIEHEMRIGMASGARGTPTFYIDDVKYEGASDIDGLRGALRAATTRPRTTVAQSLRA